MHTITLLHCDAVCHDVSLHPYILHYLLKQPPIEYIEIFTILQVVYSVHIHMSSDYCVLLTTRGTVEVILLTGEMLYHILVYIIAIIVDIILV